MSKKNVTITIAGPTGSSKSWLSLLIADFLRGLDMQTEIVDNDMNIETLERRRAWLNDNNKSKLKNMLLGSEVTIKIVRTQRNSSEG